MFTREENAAIEKYLESLIVKVLLLGQLGTGLDSILTRLIWNHTSLSEEYDPTLEEPVYEKWLQFGTYITYPVVLQCQTCSCTEYSTRVMDVFEAHVYVYSVNNRASFELLSDMHAKTLRSKSYRTTHCLFVVANKTDLPIESWQVSLEEAKEFSRSIGAEFLTMSAKTGKGCGKDDAKVLATKVLLSRIKAKEGHANGPYAEKIPGVTAERGRFGALDKILQRFRSFWRRSDPESGQPD